MMTIVITACLLPDFRAFLKRAGLPEMELQEEASDLIGTLDEPRAAALYAELEIEAEKAWRDPDATGILSFDSAFFPASPEAIHPVRQLRGLLAARLERRKERLQPACAAPGRVFRTTGNPVG